MTHSAFLAIALIATVGCSPADHTSPTDQASDQTGSDRVAPTSVQSGETPLIVDLPKINMARVIVELEAYSEIETGSVTVEIYDGTSDKLLSTPTLFPVAAPGRFVIDIPPGTRQLRFVGYPTGDLKGDTRVPLKVTIETTE